LGLLDENKLDTEHRVGACTRFMLTHMNKEMKDTDIRSGKLPSPKSNQGRGRRILNISEQKTGQHSGSPPPTPTSSSSLLSPMGGGSSTTNNANGGNNSTNSFIMCHPSEMGGNVIESWFGCTFTNMDRFKSGAKKVRETSSFVIDLKYPDDLEVERASMSSMNSETKANGNDDEKNTSLETGADLPTFLEVVRESMTRKVRVSRAWCEESKEYEALVKTRTPKRMPPVLCLNAIPTEGKGFIKMWRSKRKPTSTTSTTSSSSGGGGGSSSNSSSTNNTSETKKNDRKAKKTFMEEHAPLPPSLDENGLERWLLPSFTVRASNAFHISASPTPLSAKEIAFTESEAKAAEKLAAEASMEAGKAAAHAASYSTNDKSKKKGNKNNYKTKQDAARKKASMKAQEASTLTLKAKALRSAANDAKGIGTITYDLLGVISHIRDPIRPTTHGHVVLHANVYDTITKERKWHSFNDVCVTVVDINEVLNFDRDWRTPCVVLYEQRGKVHPMGKDSNLMKWCTPPSIPIKPSIFESPSLSTMRSRREATFKKMTQSTMLRPGDVAAIDCEFVSTSAEESHISSEGRRVVTKDPTLALARVSCLRSNGEPFIDDYIQKSEPIVDYLTRFSGLIHGDLDPITSRHHLVTLKTSYLKLRWLVDNGIIFVGHGLSKDFRMINMYVPSNQIIDTVHLFHLPGQRLLGLRYLIRYFFGNDEGIQDASRGHDSIEDAWGALRLYKKYMEFKKSNTLDEILRKLYEDGHKCGWKIK
jgi:hypothetical protein